MRSPVTSISEGAFTMTRIGRRHGLLTGLVSFAAALALAAAPAGADDRDFVRKAVENPYVFIMLDTSGSMNWTPNCTQRQHDDGKCGQVCDTGQGDCYTPLQADSPDSKFYQAKQALYQVISTIDNVQFGFFTYNQDDLVAKYKHWMYRTDVDGPTLTGGLHFPAAGAPDVFGNSQNGVSAPWPCTDSDGTGCSTGNPADVEDTWELNRVHYWPKLGDGFNNDSVIYIRVGGSTRYRVTYHPLSGTYGGNLSVRVSVDRCNSTCSTFTAVTDSPKDMTFKFTDEFLAWDNGANRAATREGYFSQGVADHDAGNVCSGWDPNTDTASDDFNGYDIRSPTDTPADARGAAFTNGDVIPADWLATKKNNILARLSPNLSATGFDQSPYFNDHRGGLDIFLRLRNASQIPLIAEGSTPIGASITAFTSWLNAAGTGWRVKASTLDPSWQCRRKYLIILTDGDDTCSSLSSVCTAVTNLKTGEAFRTFVVAFGVPGGGDALKCMAENGGQPDCTKCKVDLGGGTQVISNTCMRPGDPPPFPGGPTFATCDSTPGCQKCTVEGCLKSGELDYAQCDDTLGDPLYPQNQDELVRQLTSIFQTINEESRAFASAAVPSVEANVKDKIFLSDFTPVEGASIWAGQLDAYLKPLPFRADGSGIPEDRGPKDCGTTGTSNCHLWDAATMVLGQAPTSSDVAVGTYRLGMAANERRVYYPAGLSRTLTLFKPPTAPGDWSDLFSYNAFGFTSTTVNASNQARATSIIGTTLKQKTAVVTDRTGTHSITYVMGDVFHSDPVVIESPSNLGDFAAKKFTLNRACNLSPTSDPGYPCFAFKHQYRRKVLVVGTNDAQMHAFDAGTFNASTNLFRNGTGTEAFAYIPRMAMPIVREQAEDNLHTFGVDGPMAAGDVYFYGDTQWHTVTVGGMREGGRKVGGLLVQAPEPGATTGGTCSGTSEAARMGYFALDVTQPDPLQSLTDPAVPGGTRFLPTDDDAVPGCMSVDGSLPAGCPRIYPKLLWEFTDTVSPNGQPLDEDNTPPGTGAPVTNWGNGVADLASPWSRPVITRINLSLGNDAQGNPIVQTRFVVIVGGGLDASNKNCAVQFAPLVSGDMPDCPATANGNWIYIVDAETGLALYKRKVDGGVPSVAVVDANADNVADLIYFGTTAGSLYKVDIRTPQQLVTYTVKDRCGTPVSVSRVTAAAWNPLRIFVTGQPGARPPIYQPVQALFITRLNTHALVFGVGDRESLWSCGPNAPSHCGCGPSNPSACTSPTPSDPSSPGNTPGRAYVVVDDNFTTATTGLPRTEDNFQRVDADSPTVLGTNANLLLNPTGSFGKGWWMMLEPDERVITEAFGLSGILIFSTFQPRVTPEGIPLDRICARGGRSRNFVVFAFNGDPVSNLAGSATADRYLSLDDFVTSPFVEQTQTQNLSGSPGTGTPPPPPPGSSCTSDPRLSGIATVLKNTTSIAPPNALYGNFFLRIGQRESMEGILYSACVPIAIVQANWKEN